MAHAAGQGGGGQGVGGNNNGGQLNPILFQANARNEVDNGSVQELVIRHKDSIALLQVTAARQAKNAEELDRLSLGASTVFPKETAFEVKDPIAFLPKDVAFRVFFFLLPADLVLLRAVSKHWHAMLDSYTTNTALKHNFAILGVTPRAEDTQQEANLKFRREVFYYGSLKAGRATNLTELSSTAIWHINGDYLVVAAREGYVSLLECPPGQGMNILWKLRCLGPRGHALGDRRTSHVLCEEVYVTTSGCVMVDVRPNHSYSPHRGLTVATSMYSKRGERMWTQYLEEIAGRAYIKDDKIFRLEFERPMARRDLPPYFVCFLTERSVGTGEILHKTRVPLQMALAYPVKSCRWTIGLFGLGSTAIIVSHHRPVEEVAIFNLETRLVEGVYVYNSPKWELTYPEEHKLDFPIDVLLDLASPKSSGFQPCFLDVQMRLHIGYASTQTLATHFLRASQRLCWFDNEGALFVKDVFFQLERGIIKIRLTDGRAASERSLMESMHFTTSRPYTCVSVPMQDENSRGEKRKVFVQNVGTPDHKIEYMGMAGKFLAVHDVPQSTLLIFDFRAAW